jgi:hypothetical protein
MVQLDVSLGEIGDTHAAWLSKACAKREPVVGAMRSVQVVPPDELLQTGAALLDAVEDLEVDALAEGRLDPRSALPLV